jgi:hypothetical protein
MPEAEGHVVRAMRTGRSMVALLVGLGVALAACDHGAVILAENQTDLQLLARATGTIYTSDTGDQPNEMVSVMAPNSKLVVGEIPFAGGFKVQRIDILRDDCTLIDTLDLFAGRGSYIVIDDDVKVTLRKQYPEHGDKAETTDRCRLTPVPTPTPLRTPPQAASPSP